MVTERGPEVTEQDDYEELYERLEDVDELRPLERDRMNLSTAGFGPDSSSKNGFSDINKEQTELQFKALYDFLKYVPKSHKVKVMINGLVRFCQDMLNAPACRRRRRFEEQEAQANYWKSRLSRDDQGYITEADNLLSRWGALDLLQVAIRERRLRHGLDAVEHERARWHTCVRKKELLEEIATQLPHAAHEYFNSRMEQYNIMREEAEDRAKGIPSQDFSNLIDRIEKGEASPAEVLIKAPWPFYKAFDVAVADVDPDNPHWDHIRKLQAATAQASQRRRQQRRWSRRDDDGGGDDAN